MAELQGLALRLNEMFRYRVLGLRRRAGSLGAKNGREVVDPLHVAERRSPVAANLWR
jgi:hypothetical protein